ncbi:Pyruvate synthase subunit PorC [compost metagenome]
MVIDDSLIGTVNVTEGLKETGALLVNSSESIEKIRSKLSSFKGKIYIVDASKISRECLKANFPNTAMLAAIIKVTGIMNKEELLKDMLGSFKHKFARKPDVIEPNMQAINRAYDEVIGG